ncbi:MAG: glycosyltransferase family 39 protein [Anaerolineae bacterium]|nr:glycosyltransferase family 39 protein [Anaerolineae bacterium]
MNKLKYPAPVRGGDSLLLTCPYLGLLVVTMIGAGLRLWLIGSKGLWLDEAFSVWLARQPWAAMMRWIVQIDQHPPLYYILLHGWIALGDGEATIRALSALFSALTIPLIFALGRTLIDGRAGLLAALLLALSPFHIRFAQETRMYALLAFNAVLSMLAVARLLKAPHVRVWWAIYTVFTALTMLTHNTAVLFPIAINGIILSLILAQRLGVETGLALPPLKHWLIAQAGVLALWGFWLPAFVIQARGVYAEFWLPPPTWGKIAETLKNFLCAFLPDDLGAGHLIWLVYAAVFGLGIYHLRRRLGTLILLLGLFLIPFLGDLLVSLKRPIFYDRTLIWTTVPLYLLLAAGLTSMRWRWSVIQIVLLVILNIFSLQRYYVHFEKEEWDKAAAYVAGQARPDDLLLFNATWVQIPFDYYLDRFDLQVQERGVPVDLFDRGILEPKMAEGDLPYLHSLIAGRSRVWLVYSHNWYTDPQGLIPPVLARTLALCDRQQFVDVQVFLYAQDCARPAQVSAPSPRVARTP